MTATDAGPSPRFPRCNSPGQPDWSSTSRRRGWTINEFTANVPLTVYSKYGRRIDEVEHHSSYQRIIGHAVAAGAHTSAWADPGAAATTARAAAWRWSQRPLGPW
ncbi:hypothetical protein [Paenarthrobacter sp. PH39-S1]|uniref:hypothetical protein n=1 Tax=Paenarthrobacter sp. PH39-S1 TaxID=3046204 RepID=UPI0024B8BA64|nr:hypothetical protein [Paenarthrobacter sp. PH39-S1]MDJ0357479.1 hypothetical protein [Paenarthrobacter sp. PH39-S1]